MCITYSYTSWGYKFPGESSTPWPPALQGKMDKLSYQWVDFFFLDHIFPNGVGFSHSLALAEKRPLKEQTVTSMLLFGEEPRASQSMSWDLSILVAKTKLWKSSLTGQLLPHFPKTAAARPHGKWPLLPPPPYFSRLFGTDPPLKNQAVFCFPLDALWLPPRLRPPGSFLNVFISHLYHLNVSFPLTLSLAPLPLAWDSEGKLCQ